MPDAKAHRKPSFASSITNFRFKVSHKGPLPQVGLNEFIFEEEPIKQRSVYFRFWSITALLTLHVV